jgi:MFS family permease
MVELVGRGVRHDALPGPMLTPRQAERRLALLTATRWLPVGVVFGLTILLPLERGLSLAQVGVLLSMQGFVVLALELPTGGLADALGRRPLLIAAGVVALASTTVFLVADSFWMFAVALVLQGVFRALDSGPLEAWYVDAALATAPDAPIDRALSRAAAVLGVAIAAGALAGGALVAWHPFGEWSALALPFAVALALYAAHTVLVALLVREPRRRGGRWVRRVPRRRGGKSREPVRGVGAGTSEMASASAAGAGGSASAENPGSPGTRGSAETALPSGGRAGRSLGAVAGGLRLLARSRVLRALVLVEVFWSVAMVAFETLTPVQLAGFLGGEDAAGALFGPASAAAWGLFAVGSALAGVASRRIGVVRTAMAARILNGLFVVGMGLAAGPIGLIAAYWLAYLTHGAGGPMHSTLLHRQSSRENRAMVLSLNSMIGGGSFSLAVLVLAPLAGALTPGAAIAIAGGFSILGALLYLPALRQEHGAAGRGGASGAGEGAAEPATTSPAAPSE